MSKDDYVKILVYTPARVILALVLAFGGGVGYVHVLGVGDGSEQAQRELDSCLVAYADARSLANQQAYDIAALSDWAAGTLGTLGQLQRLEALRDAPKAYTDARGLSR